MDQIRPLSNLLVGKRIIYVLTDMAIIIKTNLTKELFRKNITDNPVDNVKSETEIILALGEILFVFSQSFIIGPKYLLFSSQL